MASRPQHCAGGMPLLTSNPGEYQHNSQQFDAVCLPEAWFVMQDKWQGLKPNTPTWPMVVVIDDGFFASDDSGIRPEIHRGYPDGTGTHPQGSAWGDMPLPGQLATYGYHGTAVLSLLSSTTDNGLLIDGVAGPWANKPNGQNWGAHFIPVRIGRFPLPRTQSLLIQAFQGVVFSRNEIRVVNISEDVANLMDGDTVGPSFRQAEARQVVIVTGAGNHREAVPENHWIKRFDNVIVVGGLNQTGSDLWNEGDPTLGTGTGQGVDLFAPAQNLTVILGQRATQISSGTSYATPLVSGVAAMILNVKPALDSWIVRDVLVKTADMITLPSGGAPIRRLNALRAVSCANVLQQSSTAVRASRVEYWSCNMGSLGAAEGRRQINF